MSGLSEYAKYARLRLWSFNRWIVQPKLTRLRSDPLIRQARQLKRAYAGSDGPTVLIIGESHMMWTTFSDNDRRTLATMVDNALGTEISTIAISGPGYNSRIVRTLLTALDGGKSRPEVVVVPVSLNTTVDSLLYHPRSGFAYEAASLRSVIARDAWSTRRLANMPEGEAHQYDKTLAPSLFDASRTYGEIDLIMHAKSKRPWQATIRMQNMLDFSLAQRLQPESLGPTLISEMSADLRSRGLPTVAYTAPMNYGALESLGVQRARDHVHRNAQTIGEAFIREAGPHSTLVDACVQFGESQFGDHLHLRDEARVVLADRIAAAVLEVREKANLSERAGPDRGATN